jgi:topoisomerase-4 subunit A
MSKVEKSEAPPPVEFADALGERYLAYALSTIMARSLPDVRDGLKPVHRRLIYAMRELKLDPRSGYKKCARVVGDVIGKYHPHGDVAVYDTLVRLAQDFAVRYPLVSGQGNFGNIDGDNPAAMRYTEARMTEIAEALLDGIDEDAVDFRPTYDGSEEEPAVLPASFPNVLANGATGIAVGMATSIPPHNLGELCDALVHLIKHRSASTADLLAFVKGPDFPTGGILAEPAGSMAEAYETGRGGFRVRARWEVEKTGRGQYQIIVTEMPYQVPKARLIEKIAELMAVRKLPQLADIRDESTDDVRLVIEPRSRSVDPGTLMESLFRRTDLETRISLNMTVLDAANTPRVMTLGEVLRAFLDHRREVLGRRTTHRLGRIAARIEVLEGYLAAYLNLDLVIKIVRTEDEPKPVIMKRLKLSEVQAEAILNMRLRALRKLEETAIATERDRLSAEQKTLSVLLGSETRQWTAVRKQIEEIRERFGIKTELGRRRTEIGPPPSADVVALEAFVEREPVTVICSQKGWIRAMKGHFDEPAEVKYKDGDRERFRFHAETTDKLVLFATNGRFYTLGCDRLPGGRGFGDPVRLLIELGNEHEVSALFVHRPGRLLLIASSDGRGFLIEEDGVVAQTRQGKQALNLAPGAEATVCRVAEGDHVAVVGENRKLVVFARDELPTMTRGRGVILQRYKDSGLADAKTFALAEGLTWRTGAGVRSEPDPRGWLGKRGAAGRLAPKGFPKSNRFG